ncbi:MAG: hypothetical protein WCE97_05635, partial [Candidatus Cybelea sp.]
SNDGTPSVASNWKVSLNINGDKVFGNPCLLVSRQCVFEARDFERQGDGSLKPGEYKEYWRDDSIVARTMKKVAPGDIREGFLLVSFDGNITTEDAKTLGVSCSDYRSNNYEERFEGEPLTYHLELYRHGI